MRELKNMLVQSMLGKLKTVNPKGFNMVQSMIQGGNNPMPLLKNLLGGMTPTQLDGFFNTAKQMGISDADIQQVRNGINTK